MSEFGSLPSLRGLRGRRTWLAGFTCALFIFSTFSIAGVDAAVLLLYGTVLWHRLREPITEPLPWWMLGAFALLPAAALISALANGMEAPLLNLAEMPTRLESLVHLRHLYRLILPLALLPALALVNRRHLLLTLAVCVAVMSVYAVIQFRWGVDWYRPVGHKVITPYHGVFAATGTFSHHLTFAGVMLMLVPLFASLAREDSGRVRWAWTAGAVLAAIAVVVSLARSGWVGMGVGLGLWLLRFPRRTATALGVVAAALAMAGVLFGTGWLGPRLGEPHELALVRRFLSMAPAENRERLYLWESALMGIRDRPWLGVGFRNYGRYVPAYREQIAKRDHFTFVIALDTHMHNVYLQVAFAMGLVGLAAYLAWWVAIFHWNHVWLRRAGAGFPLERALLYGASAGLAGIMAAGFFENNFFDAEVQTMIMLLVALCLHAGLNIRRQVTGTADQ